MEDIKSLIFDKLKLNDIDKKTMMDFPMPFELFMETILNYSDGQDLFKLFEIGSPNTNHHFIAWLCKERLVKYLITTNFDNHFETALEKLSVPYKIIYKEDDFKEVLGEDDCVTLIKLHGSVHDRENIAITIKQVANKNLIAHRKQVIDDLLTSNAINAILFMGYSYSDIFDIVPNIQKAVHEGISVFNIEHQLNYDFCTEFHPISTVKYGKVFKPLTMGSNILANTDYFVRLLWEEILGIPYQVVDHAPIMYDDIIKHWFDKNYQVNKLIRPYLAGHLSNIMSLNEKALDFFQNGLHRFEFSCHDKIDIKIDFLYSIGLTYRQLQKEKGSLQQAFRFLHMALKLALKNHRKAKAMVIQQSMGIAYADKKFYYEAIHYYQNALKLALFLNDQRVRGSCLGNIGIVLKNLASDFFNNKTSLLRFSLRFHREALSIAEDFGDKRSEGRTWGNIGITLSKMGEKLKAIECFEIAKIISEELNDILHKGIWTYNIGFEFVGIDNIKARLIILEARAIFEFEGWENHVKSCNKSLFDLGLN